MPVEDNPQEFLTSLVFLDTECFVREKWRFDNVKLSTVSELACAGSLRVLTTSVTVREIQGGLADKTIEALRCLRNFRSLAAPFTQLEDNALAPFFERPDKEAVVDEARRIVVQYFENCSAHDVPIDTVSASEVCDRYFRQEAPFGPGKKSWEFRDAFALLALEKYASDKQFPIYVVSRDKDLRSYCEKSDRLFHLTGVDVLLDLFHKDKVLTERLNSFIELHRNLLLEAIRNAFEQLGFVTFDDADIDDVSVNGVEIEEISVVKGHAEVPTVAFTVWVDFNTAFTAPNYDESIWDSEEKEYAFIDSYSGTFTQTQLYDLTLELQISAQDTQSFGVRNIQFDEADPDLNISVTDQYH